MMSLSPFLMLASLLLPDTTNTVSIFWQKKFFHVSLLHFKPGTFAVVAKTVQKIHTGLLQPCSYQCLMSSLGITDLDEMGTDF